jgi:HK97 family phage prohead protease
MDSKKERRYFPASELRVEKRYNGKKTIGGYSAVFGRLSEDLGGFQEMIAPGAFRNALAFSDVRALFNHDANHVLGRESAGTLELKEDQKGLHMDLDPPDTQFARDLIVSIERGDIKDQSFAFTVKSDKWENIDNVDKTTIRTIEEVYELFDVSIVTYPAYTDTTVALRSLDSARNIAGSGSIFRHFDSDKTLIESRWYTDPFLWEAQECLIKYSGVSESPQYFMKYNDPVFREIDKTLAEAKWRTDPFLAKVSEYIDIYIDKELGVRGSLRSAKNYKNPIFYELHRVLNDVDRV